MIKLQNMTPAVYYDKSRDFQYIGRLYDIVLNAAKTDIDTIKYINDINTCDSTLLNLLALTLGFTLRRNYNAVQLRAICSVLPTILRNKGSIKAITTACDAILAAENVQEAADFSFDNGLLTIYIPYSLSDTALIEDLLDYVLPAGICCTIVREMKTSVKIETVIGLKSSVKVYYEKDTPLQPYLSTLAEGLPKDASKSMDLNSSLSAGTLENTTIWRPDNRSDASWETETLTEELYNEKPTE